MSIIDYVKNIPIENVKSAQVYRAAPIRRILVVPTADDVVSTTLDTSVKLL